MNDLIAALFCGAFIGMERERGKSRDEGAAQEPVETRNLAGIRTHTLVAILGALSCLFGREAGEPPPFAYFAFAALALFATTAYGVRAARTGHYGMTSVPTLLITFTLGAMCVCGQRPLALALAVVVTAILAFKAPLHSFVRALTTQEVVAAVKFGLVTLALLPLLPDRNFGMQDWPWLAERLRQTSISQETLDRLQLLNPYKLWLLVVIISGIGFAGYVLVRLLGPNRGLLLTGLAGGLVSSTSVTLAMAEQSRRAPQWRESIAAAILGACAVMAVRVIVIAVVFDPGLFFPLGPPLTLMALASVLTALWLARRGGAPKAKEPIQVSTPLGLWPALQLSALMFFVRVISELAVIWMGDKGLVVTAALSGAVDVDAITVAASQQSGAERVTELLATTAILTAVAVNTISKAALVRLKGSAETAKTTFFALLVTLAAAGVGYGIAVLARASAG